MHNAKTDFDRFLLVNYKHTEANIQELRAIHFIYSGDFAKALDRLTLAGSRVNTDPLNADPFVFHIRDCHDCDAKSPHTSYTKISFVERMQLLLQAAQGRGQAANLSTDREFNAKALFMAAKAEQNRNDNKGGPEKSKNPRQYFALLTDSFSDTQYFQEIIRECGYFKAFSER